MQRQVIWVGAGHRHVPNVQLLADTQAAEQASSVINPEPPPTISHSDAVSSRRLVLLSASFFFVALLFILSFLDQVSFHE